MSTTVWESYHLRVPLEKVWTLVRPLNFAYLPTVASASEGKAALAEVGAHRTITYKDGTQQTVRVTGLSDAEYSISWELEVSVPSTVFAAQTHTVRLRRVTEGNTTFIEWNTQFSSDASQEVLSDAKFKQGDNFAALAVALGVPPSQPRLTLSYFQARGRAEISRLLLAQAGLVYEDERLTGDEWKVRKPKAPQGQMPYLTVDGKSFGQSHSIERYLARLGGLAGSSATEWLAIDAIVEEVNDAIPNFVKAISPFENKTEEEKVPKLAAYFANDFKKYTPLFDKHLKANKGGAGYLIGNKVSYADIYLWYFFSMQKQVKADVLADFPVLDGFCTRIGALPRIADWIKNRPPGKF